MFLAEVISDDGMVAEWSKAVDLSLIKLSPTKLSSSLYWGNPREFEPHPYHFFLIIYFGFFLGVFFSSFVRLFCTVELYGGRQLIVVFGFRLGFGLGGSEGGERGGEEWMHACNAMHSLEDRLGRYISL